MSNRHVLLINGSPRGRKASSQVLSDYLGVKMLEAGWQVKSVIAASAMRTEDGRAGMAEDFAAADTAVIVAPLYVDSLPSQLTAALEMLNGEAEGGPAQMAAVLNSGFPEAKQNEYAVRICRHFAEAARAEWIGAVAIGGGAMIGGKPLDVAGRFGRQIMAALDVLVDGLRTGEPVPEDAPPTIAEPGMSKAMYARGGDMMWRMQALKHGTVLRLGAKPYEERGV